VSWTVSLGEGPGLTVYDNEGILAGYAGILIGTGMDPKAAESFGRLAVEQARKYRRARVMDCFTQPLEFRQPVDDERYVLLKSTDLPEDPSKQCDGLDGGGNRCGRSRNHRGSC
jgi:hypothetical protein